MNAIWPNLSARRRVEMFDDVANRMENIAQRIGDKTLLLDRVFFHKAIYACVNKGNYPDAEKLVKRMHDLYGSGENLKCKPNFATYSILLSALNPSNATDQAEAILHNMPDIDASTYNSYLRKFLVKNGLLDKAEALIVRMQNDFDTGKNLNCKPNVDTYLMLLMAIERSKQSNAHEKAADVLSFIKKPTGQIVQRTLEKVLRETWTF
jgi:hypothetical protein